MHNTRWTNAKRVSQELSRALMTWRCAMMNGRAAMVTCHTASVTKQDSRMCCTNCFQSQANAVMLLTRSNSVTRVAHMHCMLKVPPRRIILLLSSGAKLASAPARSSSISEKAPEVQHKCICEGYVQDVQHAICTNKHHKRSRPRAARIHSWAS